MRSPTVTRVLLGLLCVAILATRVGGAHLHLCLDGGEAPASVHLLADLDSLGGPDADGHGHAGKTHHDVDASLTGEVVAKKFGGARDLPAFVVTVIVLLIAAVPAARALIPHGNASSPPAVSVFRIRPPLRAPPF